MVVCTRVPIVAPVQVILVIVAWSLLNLDIFPEVAVTELITAEDETIDDTLAEDAVNVFVEVFKEIIEELFIFPIVADDPKTTPLQLRLEAVMFCNVLFPRICKLPAAAMLPDALRLPAETFPVEILPELEMFAEENEVITIFVPVKLTLFMFVAVREIARSDAVVMLVLVTFPTLIDPDTKFVESKLATVELVTTIELADTLPTI